MYIHHIGVITKDINKSINIYLKLNYKIIKGIVYDQVQNNNILLLTDQNNNMIELIEPLNEKSSIYNFNEGYHHICYEVHNKENFKENFKKLKIGKIFTPYISAPAFDNRKVLFACLNDNSFVEFILLRS